MIRKNFFTITSLSGLVLVLFVSHPIQAQTDSANSGESPFVAVVERVLPTVVNISAEKTINLSPGKMFPGIDEFFEEFFWGLPLPSPEQHIRSLGSGVIISADGYIVTNNHVIADYEDIVIKLVDGMEFKGEDVKVVGRDPQTDLAVIKVNTKKPLPTITYADPATIKVGDWAIAIGNPFGLQGTVTVGIISAKGRTGIPLPEGPTRQDFIQTDAAINPGNSGGALVNIKGELIGINTAISSPVGVNVGVGFAVPVTLVKSVTEQLIAHGKVIRGYLGIRPQVITEKIRQALQLKDTTGVLIGEVLTNTPAEKAGLKAGDVILAINDEPVNGVENFRNRIAEFKPGTEITLTIVRDRKQLTKKVTLAEFPEEPQVSIQQEKKDFNRWGIKVENLSPSEKSDAGVTRGVKVVAVERGGLAEKAGVERGDIILRVGDEDIEDRADFERVAKKLANAKEPVLLYIQRSGQRMFVAIGPQ